MWCTRLVHCLFIVLLLSAINSEIFAFEEQGLEPVNREKIMDDLLSLLGLGLSSNTSQSEHNPSIDADINPSVTPTIARDGITDNTVTDYDDSIISDQNETYTTNTNSTTNLTDSSINMTISAGNSNNSEITVSGNDSLSSANFTVIPLNESYSLTEFANDTNQNASIISSIENANNMTTNESSILELNHDLGDLNNETMNESLALQNQTAPDEISPLADNSTVSLAPQVPNNSSLLNCSVLPNFETDCQLPSEYFNQSDSLMTFADVKKKMSCVYLQSCLLKYCEPGEWCLGEALDNLVSESLNVSSKFCAPTFHACLASTEASHSSCAYNEKLRVIRLSLELICKYKELLESEPTSHLCGFHLMKLISVTLADLEREDPIIPGLDFCFSQRGYLMISFNCLLTQCPDEFGTILTEFEPWKWFTEGRTEAMLCRTYYECDYLSSTISQRSTTTTSFPFLANSYTKYPFERESSETSDTSETFFDVEMTTQNNLFDDKAALDVLKGLNEEQSEEKFPDSHSFGNSVADNSHMMASLSAMMVILMIGMVIMMVACWRHFRKNRSHRKGGYSKLKTGEC